MKKGLLVPFALMAALTTAGTASAATEDTARVGIGGGEFTLSVQEANSFGTVTLEKQKKTVFTGFAGDFNTVDARGTQEGWRINVTATPFQIVEPAGGWKSGTSTHVLPTGSLALKPLQTIERVWEGAGEANGGAPTKSTAESTIIDDGSVTVASAEKGSGMGEFTLAFPNDALELTVDPTTAYVDTVNYTKDMTPYESTITWELVTAP